MAKASEQFRQSDVALWGIVALVCGGLAIVGSNVSAVVPQSLLGGLHTPRVAGSSIETLRQQVSDLSDQSVRLRRENEALLTRFSLQEKTGNEVLRRVGALEVSMPKLLEALPDSALVDRTNLTASVGENQTLTYDAEGGSVAIRQLPMPGATTAVTPNQPLPELIIAPQSAAVASAPTSYGIALGAPVAEGGTMALWNDLTLKLGPLLFGLVPVVTDDASGQMKRIVVGPIDELSEAGALCERFERVAIACAPSPYVGTALELGDTGSEGG